MSTKSFSKKLLTNVFLGMLFAIPLFFAQSARADVILPDDLRNVRGNSPVTCGELAISGTYTLTSDVGTSGQTCFTITSDGVVITSSTTENINGNISNGGFTATLDGSVVNNGTISGNAIFQGDSSNTGTISGNVEVFAPSSNPIGGTVSGFVGYHGYPSSLSDNLKGYWALDGSFLDSSGNGNDGIVSGGVSSISGKFGGGSYFNQGHIQVQDSPSLEVTNSLTMSVWVKTVNQNDLQILVSKHNSNYPYSGYVFFLYQGTIYLQGSSGNYWMDAISYNVGANYYDDNWHNISVSYDESNLAKFYFDGALIDSTYGSGPFAINNRDLWIGEDVNSVGSGFVDGSIDEVAIWSRALSDSEIGSIYNNGIALGSLYFSASSDSDWSNLSNWYQDSGFTISALTLPRSVDTVIVSANVSSVSKNNAIASNTIFNNANFGVGLSLTGDAVLNGTSVNNGTINGNVKLSGSAENTGTINGNADVYYPAPNPIGGTVTGTVTYHGVWPVLPGNVSSCGVITQSGTYTLTSDISAAGTCFTVQSEGVIIDGAGHTITGNGSGYGVDASNHSPNASGYSVTIQNITLNNFGGGVTAAGVGSDIYQDNTSGAQAGNGGNITIASSTLTSVDSSGAAGGDDYNYNYWTPGYGGSAGTISITNSTTTSIVANGGNGGSAPQYPGSGGNAGNVTLTNSTFTSLSILGGSIGSSWWGYYGNGETPGSNGSLVYSGSAPTTAVTLSALSGLTINSIDYGVFPGGAFPVFPGTISSCGTFLESGTYTLDSDISNVSGTCFQVLADNVVIEGSGHTVTGNGSGYGINASSYSPSENGHSVTIQNITLSNFGGGVISSGTGADIYQYGQGIAAGSGGNITINSSTLGSIQSIGGTGGDDYNGNWYTPGAGGVGGFISLTNSTTTSITTSGGTGGSGPYSGSGGNGGTITLTDSSFTSLSAAGGNIGSSWYGYRGYGEVPGSGGSIVINRENIDLIGKTLLAPRGTLILNYADTLTASASTTHSSFSSVTFQHASDEPVVFTNITSTDRFNGASFLSIPRTLYFNYNNTGDSQWYNLSNWWNDASNSVQADDYPRVGDTVYINTYISDSSTISLNFANLFVSSNNRFSLTNLTTGTTTLFSGSSYNSGVITGTTTFKDTTSNRGTITGDASFYNNSSNQNGATVTGLCKLYDGATNNGSCGSIEYHKPFYYNNATGDGKWDTRGNWWFDTNFTQPVPFTPQVGDVVTIYAAMTEGPSNPVSLGNITVQKKSIDWVQRTSVGARNWASIGMSSDGVKLAAVAQNGYVYTSTDSGATWTQRFTGGSGASWQGITSSSDGTKLAANLGDNYIYTSSDSGVNWVKRTALGSHNWIGITSSSDGTKLVAVAWNDYIYTSTDSGATWTTRTGAGQRYWATVTSSSDGTKVAAGVHYSGKIYTSSDSGANWEVKSNSPSQYWTSISSSADGTKLVAGANNGGYAYTSADSGNTWTRINNHQFAVVSLSADGTKMTASGNSNDSTSSMYVSNDFGVTWIQQTSLGVKGWNRTVVSSNGLKISTVAWGDYIYTYDSTPLPSFSVNFTGASGNVYLYPGTTNTGTINGDLHIFGSRTLSDANSGTVNGNIEFNDTTGNDTTVIRDAIFNGVNQNTGTILGNVTNNGVLGGNGTTTGTTTNNGEISGGTFIGAVTNIGGIISGAVNNLASMVFNGASSISHSGSISGSGTFNNTSTNGGIVGGNAVFKNESTNYFEGIIRDNATTLMLHFNGENNSLNFVDSSSFGRTITRSGDAHIDTSASKFGGASISFDGNGDWINTPSSSDFDFETSPWTVDFWWMTNDTGRQYQTLINSNPHNGLGVGFNHSICGSGKLDLALNETQNDGVWTAIDCGSKQDFQAGVWYHTAIVYDGSKYVLYVNGVADITETAHPQPIRRGVRSFRFGAIAYGSETMNGRIDELRIVKGKALWNSNFTPPSRDSRDVFAGVVQGSATFVGDLSENTSNGISGIVNGVKTRLYTAANNQLNLFRNFITDGAWTIVADNTYVKLLYRSLIDIFGRNSNTTTTLSTTNNGFILKPLTPGVITSCGVLDTENATYTLSTTTQARQNFSNYKYDTCFVVRANGVTINGSGVIVSAQSSSTSIYAVTATSTVSIDTTANAFTNLTVKNIVFRNFAHGILGRGSDVPSGIGGNGASTTLDHVTIGDIDLSGGDPDIRGGDGGVLNLITSTTTYIYAKGGDVNSCSGIPGDGGAIVSTTDSKYSPPPENEGGVNHATNCQPNQPGSTHTTGSRGVVNNTVISEDTRVAQAAAVQAAADAAAEAARLAALLKAKNLGSRSAEVQAPGLKNIFTVLPDVVKLDKLKLKNTINFGDTTSKNSFSLIDNVSNFLFSPLPESITKPLDKTLIAYLKFSNFSKETDLIKIKKTPLSLPNTERVVPGLWKITTKGLPVKTGDSFTTNTTVPVSTYLTTSDLKSLQQKITLSPKTNVVITLPNATAGIWNGKPITFLKNTYTLTTPTKPGLYTLTSPSSPLTLVIEVTAPKASVPTPTTSSSTSWFTKILNFFKF